MVGLVVEVSAVVALVEEVCRRERKKKKKKKKREGRERENQNEVSELDFVLEREGHDLQQEES